MSQRQRFLQLFFATLLIMCHQVLVTAQDTLYVNGESLNEIVTYKASQKIVHDVKLRRIYLFGNAEVQSEGFLLKAGFILIDIDSNQVEASYRVDSLGTKVEFPELTEGTETIRCETLKMNYKTQKAYIKALAIKQDEFYFKMGTAKRQANKELHLRQGMIYFLCHLVQSFFRPAFVDLQRLNQ